MGICRYSRISVFYEIQYPKHTTYVSEFQQSFPTALGNLIPTTYNHNGTGVSQYVTLRMYVRTRDRSKGHGIHAKRTRGARPFPVRLSASCW